MTHRVRLYRRFSMQLRLSAPLDNGSCLQLDAFKLWRNCRYRRMWCFNGSGATLECGCNDIPWDIVIAMAIKLMFLESVEVAAPRTTTTTVFATTTRCLGAPMLMP